MKLRRFANIGLLCTCLLAVPSLSFARASDDAEQRILQIEQDIAADGFSASRLLALGRAQLDAGRLGPAIVSFERGLVLAPRDEQLRVSLEQTRSAAGVQAPPRAWPERMAHQLSLREWAYAAFGATMLLALALVGLATGSRWRRSFAAVLAGSGLLGAVAGAGVAITSSGLERAYVLSNDSAVRQSPFSSARTIASLRAGESVWQIEQHGGFAYIETGDGVSGWMARDDIRQLAAAEL